MAALAPVALKGHIPNFKRRWALPWKANRLLDGAIFPNLIAFQFYTVALHTLPLQLSNADFKLAILIRRASRVN